MAGWRETIGRFFARGGPRLESVVARGFVALDLETTGLDPRRDRIVSVAAIRFVSGEPAESYVTLVNPGCPIPETSTRIHGITDSDVVTAPRIDAVLPSIERWLDAALVVGHAVDFDLAVLRREQRVRRRRLLPAHTWLDTQRLAAALYPHRADYGLDAVAAAFGVPVEGRHTARGDAVAAGRILLTLVPALIARGVTTLWEARWLQRHAVFPPSLR